MSNQLSYCIIFAVWLFVGEVDYKEIGDCVHVSGYSSTDLCLPALDYLRKCSQVGKMNAFLSIKDLDTFRCFCNMDLGQKNKFSKWKE